MLIRSQCEAFLMIFSRSLLFLSRKGRTWALNSECKIDYADFTDWLSFLTSNIIEENNPNLDALSAKLYSFNRHGITEKAKNHIGINTLI